MILQRIRITVGDARFEPGTSAPKVCGALQMSHHTSIFINTLVLTVQYVQYVLYSVHSFFYFFIFFFIFEHAVWRTYVSLFCWWWLCLWARWAWWGQQGEHEVNGERRSLLTLFKKKKTLINLRPIIF